MKRLVKLFALACILCATSVSFASAEEKFALSSQTGNMLRGAVYKQSGIVREGLITIHTSWNYPSPAPELRYDFDVIHGVAETRLYSFLLADISEITFLPLEKGSQPVVILLRNGLMQKVYLSSDDKTIGGRYNLKLKEAVVTTEGFGENIIAGGDVMKIVLFAPSSFDSKGAAGLVDLLGMTIEQGKRDRLADEEYLKILDNIQKKLKKSISEAK